MAAKSDPVTIEFETRAKNLLKGELKRRGITYAQLAEKLAQIGVTENERNLSSKPSGGSFTLLSCSNVSSLLGRRNYRINFRYVITGSTIL